MSVARGLGGGVKRALDGFLFMAAGLALAAPALAQAPCTRADLQASVANFIEAQAAGEPTKLHMNLWLDYNEQLEGATMSTGLLSTPLKIAFHRDLLDTTTCTTFTEAVISDPANPRVIGVMLSARGGDLGAISVIATDKVNGWLFNPANTLKYSAAETWSEIPVADRDSRDTLVAAANAYLDYFNNKKVVVPWGAPCERLEGGLYTGKGGPGASPATDTCDVGVPDKVKIVNRTYVVDEALGAVTVLSNFGSNALPDAHTFRVEKGKLRYVHTITVCKTANCGFKLPPELASQ